jgi:predicted O-methyltransferase YrrM
MTTADKVFTGSIPELYDRLLVPLIFEPYARDLAGRVAQAGARDVLETAAGTGVVTRALAAALPADVRITATDLNQPMLDRAQAQQASIARRRSRRATSGSNGSKPMRSRCRSAIRASTRWPASSA